MLGTEDEPAKVTSMSPCGMAGWEKAAGTPAGTAWHRAWPRGYQSPRAGGGDGDGGGGALQDGEFVGPFPDDNFDILLSLENFEIGINAASVLICTDCRCQTGG